LIRTTRRCANQITCAPSEQKSRKTVLPELLGWTGTHMIEQHPAVTFGVRRLARAPGWYVRVEWPSGKRDHIPGFVSRDEALRWIDQNSGAWARDAGGSNLAWHPPRSDPPAGPLRQAPRPADGGPDFSLPRDARSWNGLRG